MKQILILSILINIGAGVSVAQIDSLYLGQVPPGNSRKVFELETSQDFMATERIAISPDGKEIFFEETNAGWSSFHIKRYRYFNKTWNGPDLLFTGYYAIALSPNGDSLFLENNNYKDVWVSAKDGNNWEQPTALLSEFDVHSLNMTDSGNYYFGSSPANGLGNLDICRLIISGTDTVLSGLGLPLNSGSNEGDFFISKDESFIVFMSNRSGGVGNEDLYVSFNKGNDLWTNPKNLGTSINTSTSDFGPYVTDDNDYLFYASGYTGPSTIYWIRFDEILDSLKNSNYSPYVLKSVPDQTDTVGNYYSYILPDSLFIDDDGNNTLTYTAELSNGSDLPDSLQFDSGIISGKLSESGSYDIKITATDTAGASVSKIFRLTVVDKPLQIKNMSISNRVLVFPNPANQFIRINKDVISEISGYEILDLNGRIVQQRTVISETIDISGLGKGVFIIKLKTNRGILVNKLCVN